MTAGVKKATEYWALSSKFALAQVEKEVYPWINKADMALVLLIYLWLGY